MPKKNKQQRRINARKLARLEKAANNTTTEQRQSKRQLSTAAIKYIKQVVDTLKPFELSPSQRYRTFALMMMDDAVWSSFDSRATAMARAQANGKLKYNKQSAKSKEVKDFLEYCMNNMDTQTPRSIGRSCAEMVKNGAAPHEMVLKRQAGKYSDKWILKKLSFIDLLTLDTAQPFNTTPDGDEILALRQRSAAFSGMDGNSFIRSQAAISGHKEVDWRKIAICAYSATSSTPLGTSPLEAAYSAWREKQFLQETLMIGVTRDFSGIPVLRLPSEVLEAAESDPSSPEAQQVLSLTTSMQAMHTADSTYVVLPSDSQSDSGTGLRDYDMEFKGIDGAGKNFDVEGLVEQKKRAIYNVMSTQHLISGENGGSSYNLQEGQASIAALVSDHDNMIIDEMWNKQIFPMLLRINGIKLEDEADMPKWVHGSVQPLSLEEKSKYIQRTMRILPAVPDVVNNLLEDMGVDYRVDEKATPDEIREMTFDFKEESKAGMSEGSSGVGDSQTGGANSATNSDNAA